MRLRHLLPGFVLVFACACGNRSAEPEVATDHPGTIESLSADGLRFDLTIDPCVNDVCPMSVHLLKGGKLMDTTALPVQAHTWQVRTEEVNVPWGADPETTAWRAGEDAQYVGTAARLVEIAPGLPALLVTQRHGFDNLKREHVLLAPIDGKLKEIWSAREPQGTTWTATRVDGPEIVYLSGLFHPVTDVADRMEAWRVRWDQAAREIRVSRLPDSQKPLYFLNAGVYPNVLDARRARNNNPNCLGAYFVLETDPLPGLPPGNLLLAQVAGSLQHAYHLAGETLKCSGRMRPAVVEYKKKDGT